MSRFKGYSPDQAYLLPPSVRDELGSDHLCFFVCRVVELLDLSRFEQAYGVEGGALYAPELMLGVWPYAYALRSLPRVCAVAFISNMIQLFLMPLIMIGQNLQGRGAEEWAKNDYKVNKKAEQEIEQIQAQLAAILARLEEIKAGTH